jgi:chromosome segregation ATPase
MLNTSLSKLLNSRTSWTLGIAALALAGVASGQGRRPEATLDELVVEVQALRAEMNHAAAASIRAQLLVGRLQMEDQRIAGVMREIEAVQADLAANTQLRGDSAARIRTLEDALASAGPELREEADNRLAAAKSAAQQAERRQQALKRRENGLAKELQEDQARWRELNERLQNFEQSIPGR